MFPFPETWNFFRCFFGGFFNFDENQTEVYVLRIHRPPSFASISTCFVAGFIDLDTFIEWIG